MEPGGADEGGGLAKYLFLNGFGGFKKQNPQALEPAGFVLESFKKALKRLWLRRGERTAPSDPSGPD